ETVCKRPGVVDVAASLSGWLEIYLSQCANPVQRDSLTDRWPTTSRSPQNPFQTVRIAFVAGHACCFPCPSRRCQMMKREWIMNQTVVQFVKAFIAGFVSTLLFHQGVLALFYLAGAVQRTPYDLGSGPPFGIPAVISLAFWRGVW